MVSLKLPNIKRVAVPAMTEAGIETTAEAPQKVAEFGHGAKVPLFKGCEPVEPDTKETLIDSGFEQFRMWDDGSGGYFWPTDTSFSIFREDLSLERSRICLELGAYYGKVHYRF